MTDECSTNQGLREQKTQRGCWTNHKDLPACRSARRGKTSALYVTRTAHCGQWIQPNVENGAIESRYSHDRRMVVDVATIRDLLVRLVADSQEKSPRGPAFEPCQSASRYMNAASPDAWMADWPVATPEASLLRTGGQVSTL